MMKQTKKTWRKQCIRNYENFIIDNQIFIYIVENLNKNMLYIICVIPAND